MITSRLLIVTTIAVMAFAAAQTLTSVEVPITVALEPEYHAVAVPATLDHGTIKLGIPGILSTVNVTSGNTETSLWCSVIDGPGGWTLGPEAGPDQYAIKVNGVSMTETPQEIAPYVAAYAETGVSFYYYPPTQDTIGAGVDQGYRMRVEAQPATYQPPDAPVEPAV